MNNLLYTKGKILTREREFNSESFALGSHIINEEIHLADLTLIIDDKSASTVLSIISCVIAKRTIILLDSSLVERQLASILNAFKPGVILGSKKQMNKCGFTNQIETELFNLCKLESSPNKEELTNSPLLLLGTSGSSGTPKYVGLTYENLLTNCSSICDYLENDKDTRSVNNLPCSYSYGLSVLNTTLFKGGSYICSEEPSIIRKSFWDDLKYFGVTDFSGVPKSYRDLNNLDYKSLFPKSIKHLTQAGGKLEKEIQMEFLSWSLSNQIKLFIMYGQTEATARLTYLELTREPSKIGSVGRPINGVTLDLNENRSGEEVELIFKGRNISLGYFTGREQLINPIDNNCGRLKTGDLGIIDKDGCISITGRTSRFAKIDGYRISLDALEGELRLNIRDIALVSDDDLIYVVVPGDLNPKEEYIINRLKDMTGISRRKFLLLRLNIPITSSGKIAYKQLLNNIQVSK